MNTVNVYEHSFQHSPWAQTTTTLPSPISYENLHHLFFLVSFLSELWFFMFYYYFFKHMMKNSAKGKPFGNLQHSCPHPMGTPRPACPSHPIGAPPLAQGPELNVSPRAISPCLGEVAAGPGTSSPQSCSAMVTGQGPHMGPCPSLGLSLSPGKSLVCDCPWLGHWYGPWCQALP